MEDSNNYLNILLNDNEQLKNLLTAYLNMLVALKTVYARQNGELQEQYQARLMQTVKPEERQAIINVTTGFRAYATRIKISINTVKDKFSPQLLEQINSDYNEIKTLPMPNYEVCENFVQNINDLLMLSLDMSIKFRKVE